ncbi:MAG: rRNA maturation RNase YbeY [Bacilli bacterium]|nr:rRNA maturation RNase YbeY [Bacilli bacterium]
MNYFEIINETNEEIKELVEVNKLIEYALKHENLENVFFNIIIVDNKKIRELNREYRNKDAYTDVISFALEDFDDIKTEVRMLGDIYISIDKAQGQAIDYNHSLLRELSFLSIHGLLHLLGYDHMKEDEEKIMFSKQKEILDNYGISREN